LKIRPAKREEVGEVLQLIQDLATYEKAPDQVEASRDDLLNTIFAKEPRVFCDLVEVDGQIAGMAIWFLNYSTWQAKHGIYLEDLYIKPEFRAKGYGKALLKHLAQICDREGYGRLQWWVLDWNSTAIEFYRSFGAEAMDEWTVYRTSGQALKDLGN
jgi:GNAT superfamily N-acetyltransferase